MIGFCSCREVQGWVAKWHHVHTHAIAACGPPVPPVPLLVQLCICRAEPTEPLFQAAQQRTLSRHALHRHIMLTSFDAGPNENFDWNRDNTLDPDYAPNSPTRPIIYMTFNGCSDTFVEGSYRHTCMVCFQRGKDIMLPTCQSVCGPLCGYSREQLREKTMWLLPQQQMQQEFKRTRSHLLYFAGAG